MPVGAGGIADEIFQLCPSEIARHHLAFGELLHRRRVSDLAADIDTGDRHLDVMRIGQEIGFDFYRIARMGAGQPNPAPAPWPFQAAEQRPAFGGW